ncbi:MAG: glycosyltransferase [Oscillospiraceae bacterium]|nr:glycosyltransferase [Oscillospiraceae bacterium]
MDKNREKNFVSAVIYLSEREELIAPFISMVNGVLSENFEKYEIVCVNDASPLCAEAARRAARENRISSPLTIINMSVRQGTEPCMNAGIDAAIGDYIFEFDSPELCFEPSLIMDCYRKCLEGSDIVSAAPSRGSRAASRLFYSLFNAASKSAYKLRTDAFHLLSRRAVNRLHAINPNMPYRKAAYAASGLKLAELEFEPTAEISRRRGYRAAEAADALALYTDAAYKISFAISAALLAVTLAAVVYTIVIFLSAQPVAGWTTTMILLSAGFFGVFLLMTFVLKYLSLLVDLSFRNQKYLVESIEKIQYE